MSIDQLWVILIQLILTIVSMAGCLEEGPTDGDDVEPITVDGPPIFMTTSLVSAMELSPYSATIVVEDEDPSNLTVTMISDGGATFLSWNPDTNTLTGTPYRNDSGVNRTIRFSATDGNGSVTLHNYTLWVKNADRGYAVGDIPLPVYGPDRYGLFLDLEGSFGAMPIVIEFFSPDCGHCQAFVPTLKQLAGNHSEITILSVAMRWDNPGTEEEETVTTPELAGWEDYFETTWTHITGNLTVHGSWKIHSTPTTIGIHSNGTIAWRHSGTMTYEELEELALTLV